MTMEELNEAVERVTVGLEKKQRIMSKEEKQRLAYHESAHALAAYSLPNTDPVHKVSIIPRGLAALGYTMQRPEGDRYVMTQSELESHIQVFLAEKHFEGKGGLTMSDEVRVTIAAQACLLLLHRRTDYYPGLHSIVVYPGEYLAPYREVDEWGIVTEGRDCRSGESCPEGALVLSWEDVVAEGLDVHPGAVLRQKWPCEIEVSVSMRGWRFWFRTGAA